MRLREWRCIPACWLPEWLERRRFATAINNTDEGKDEYDGGGQESLLSVSSRERQDDIDQPERSNKKPDGRAAHGDWRIASRPVGNVLPDCSQAGSFLMKNLRSLRQTVYSKEIPL